MQFLMQIIYANVINLQSISTTYVNAHLTHLSIQMDNVYVNHTFTKFKVLLYIVSQLHAQNIQFQIIKEFAFAIIHIINYLLLL